jgi:hypothetical protein
MATTKPRKRTGANKRTRKLQLGSTKPPDETKVRTATQATTFFESLGRYELTSGMSLRVAAVADVAAFPALHAKALEYGRQLAERQLPATFTAGIAPLVSQLNRIVSMDGSPDDLGAPGSADDVVMGDAFKFVSVRRRAVGRIAKGSRNRALRHAFGVSQATRPGSADEVRSAVVALLTGRASHPNTPAARMITAADAKKAKAFIAQLEDIKSRMGARRTGQAETVRVRDVLHAALELYYDRFAAAVELAFEGDDATRVALLSLVPRRREQRRAVPSSPAQVASVKVA